jgi:hypothetical protein
MKIMIEVGRVEGEALKGSFAINLPPEFQDLDSNSQVLALGGTSNYLASRFKDVTLDDLVQLKEAVQIEIVLEMGPDGALESAELVWPESLCLAQRLVVAKSASIGLHRCAIECAGRLAMHTCETMQ